MNHVGALALVGSGEYLPEMAPLEGQLLHAAIERGKQNRYVQIPLAAGKESESRLQYWKELGLKAADRLESTGVFLPIFNREDAMREDLAAQISDAGLIYLSGGDPTYLAQALIDTPVWKAIESTWKSGSSLAGCSAGAMVFGGDVPNFRKQSAVGTPGLNLFPTLRTIPHYDKFFGVLPDPIAKVFVRAPEGVHVIGVDELTAAVCGLDSGTSYEDLKFMVHGKGGVHILRGAATHTFKHGEIFSLH